MSPSPTPQGVNSATFCAPPFDRTFSIPGLYDYHTQHSPNHPAYTWTDEETGISTVLTYSDVSRCFHIVAQNVATYFADAKERYTLQKRDKNQPPVIAIFALSGKYSMSFIFTILAIISLGLTAFPVSLRNSPAVTAHLLKTTGALVMLASGDETNQRLAREAADILAREGIKIDIVPMTIPDDWIEEKRIIKVSTKSAEIGDDTITLILQTSGTTALPKAIKITKKGQMNLANTPRWGEVDLAGKRVGAHTNPLFHAMGQATVSWPATCGATFAVYKPKSTPNVPTPANFMSSWVADKCNIVFSIPAFIEVWAQDPEKVAKLQELDCLVFSGASVAKDIGDRLAAVGVFLHPLWGSTEVGPATAFIPRDPPPLDAWDWFTLTKQVEFRMIPHPSIERVFEPIMVATENFFPPVFNTTFEDGTPAYAVGDLLERHPTDPRRYRMFGRKDDLILLALGEHVNPIPLESMLTQDKRIAAAIVFGNYKVQTGVLIQPSVEYQSEDPSVFKELIWPTVENVNSRVPSYARIAKNMILTTSSLKPLEYTAKATPRRAVCLNLYAAEIERLYQEAAPTAEQEFPDRM